MVGVRTTITYWGVDSRARNQIRIDSRLTNAGHAFSQGFTGTLPVFPAQMSFLKTKISITFGPVDAVANTAGPPEETRMLRRDFLKAAGTAVGASLFPRTGMAAPESLAGTQIRLIVPFPAGGPTDIVARPVAQALGEALKATLVVDNRGGAGGSIGANAVAKSAPDGHTLLMATVGTQAINPALYKNLPYDAVRDFTPIALVAVAPVAIVTNPALPVNNLAELVALAKRTPGKLNYGSAGPGTPGHLTAEMFKSAAAIDIQHVPYKGSAPAVTDLLGGQIQIMFDPLQSVLSNVQAGKLRAVAVSSKMRPSILPNVPTIAESGYDGFESTAWWGLFGPAGLAPGLTAIFTSEIERIVRDDSFRSKLEPLGVVPTVLSGNAFAAFQLAELAKWGKAVHESGAKVDQ
jgi:tripartite-type tricarboxylate transporter receptor subunit TctC